MAESLPHHTEHSRIVRAPWRAVYDLVADAARWPAIFGPSVYLRHLERGERAERFQLWAVTNDEVRNWTSARVLDRPGRRIRFEQEHSERPVTAMGGDWTFRPRPDGTTLVVLRHHFTAIDDDPSTVRWITEAVDRNSPTELDALARIAELGCNPEEVVFSFQDSLPVPGSAADAYDFVYRADLWPQRLPHVGRVALVEDRPGIQDLRMETVTPDGSSHTTRSVRICFPYERIAYKQVLVPSLLLGHSGEWIFTEGTDHAVITSRHTVVLNPAAFPDVSIADARERVRAALVANSETTMGHAASFAAERRSTEVNAAAPGEGQI